jgi:putative redox protein
MREEKVFSVNATGETLAGILHYPQSGNARGAVILCHGMESSKESEKLVFLGQALAQRDMLALRFDFACAGESSGEFENITYSGEVEDLKAAFLFMRTRYTGKIAILGSSMGGTVALLFAAQNPEVASVVTVAAPLHPERFLWRLSTPEELQQWRDRGFTLYHGQRINVSLLDDLERINVPDAAKRVSCPVLILHGDRDEVVPVEEAHELHRYIPGAKKLSILQGGDHRLSDPLVMNRAVGEAMDWLCEYAG